MPFQLVLDVGSDVSVEAGGPKKVKWGDTRRLLYASKTAAALLPKRMYEGEMKIVDASNEERLGAALKRFEGEAVLGFDTETKPSWQAGKPNNPTALVQLATANFACLIRLRKHDRWLYSGPGEVPHVPPALVALLEDAETRKAGVGVEADLRQMRKEHPVRTL